MEITNQIQKAGDHSQQIQAGTVIIQNGISEERARAIYLEMSKEAIKECTNEASAIANERIVKFENVLVPKIQQIESDFKSFSDPGFQVLLKKAQLTAMCSARQDDYKLLSELLVHRIKNKTNIKKKASITRAVEIIDQIDDDALNALTVFHAINSFIPVSGNIEFGLQVLDTLYSKLNLEELPNDSLWIDNLSILGAINIIPFAHSKKYEDYLVDELNGYVCVGIRKDSQEYVETVINLISAQISPDVLVDNILLSGYMRVSLSSKNNIAKSLNDAQKSCINNILNSYIKNPELETKVKQKFYELFYSFESIKKAFEWKNSIKQNIALTSIGRVIAHTNAKRIDNSLPDLD